MSDPKLVDGKLVEDDAYVIVPSGFGVVERDPRSEALSVPVYPIGYVLPLEDNKRFLVFYPNMEMLRDFAQMILHAIDQHEAAASKAKPVESN